jgi:hypothetical protein
MLTVFWDSQGVLLAHFQKRVEMSILHRTNTVKFCWSFVMKFAGDIQAKWQEGYCFVMTMPDPIQLEQLRREFKSCSGNFLNILFTAQILPLVTSIFWSAEKSPWWPMFCWWRRGWNVGAEMAETTVKRLACCRFWCTGKEMGQVYQCWWWIFLEINAFCRFEYHIFYVLYPFVTYLPTLPRISSMNDR